MYKKEVSGIRIECVYGEWGRFYYDFIYIKFIVLSIKSILQASCFKG